MENQTTGVTPYNMVYGKAGRGPLEVLRDTWAEIDEASPVLNKSTQEYLSQLKSELTLCNDVAAKNCEISQRAYVEQYNVRSRPKQFSVGDTVLILIPDSSNKLKSSWQGPGIIHFKLSDNSYTIAMPNGAIRHLHANHIREFRVQVQEVGIIFEDEADKYGEIEYCETGLGPDEKVVHNELTMNKPNDLDLSHLRINQQNDLRKLLWKYKKVFNDKPGICKFHKHKIELEPGFKPIFLNPIAYQINSSQR